MIKSQIITYLQCNKYAKRSDLLVYLTTQGFFITDRILRKAVEDLVMLDGLCIASTDHGYRIIRDAIQLEEAVEYLRKKARPIAVRANKLITNYQRIHKTQLQITF